MFGKASGFDASLDLAALDGTNGFRLDGIDPYEAAASRSPRPGTSTATALAISSSALRLTGGTGESYVVFGRASGFGASLDLATLDGTNGFRLDGIDAGELQRSPCRWGRGRQWRWLRRCRSVGAAEVDTGENSLPARVTLCSAEPRGSVPASILRASTAPTAFASTASTMSTRAVSRSPGPGTSTATALPILSSALLRVPAGLWRRRELRRVRRQLHRRGDPARRPPATTRLRARPATT